MKYLKSDNGLNYFPQTQIYFEITGTGPYEVEGKRTSDDSTAFTTALAFANIAAAQSFIESFIQDQLVTSFHPIQ